MWLDPCSTIHWSTSIVNSPVYVGAGARPRIIRLVHKMNEYSVPIEVSRAGGCLSRYDWHQGSISPMVRCHGEPTFGKITKGDDPRRCNKHHPLDLRLGKKHQPIRSWIKAIGPPEPFFSPIMVLLVLTRLVMF
jgi:hypothetical protein